MSLWRLPVRVGALLGIGLSVWPAAAVAQRRSPTVADVQVTPDQAQVQVGRTAYFIANAFDASGNPLSTATFTWSSSNRSAAIIDQNGMATGVAPGITIITAQVGTGARAKRGQATLEVLSGGPTPQPQTQPQALPTTPQPPAPHPAASRPAGPGCAAWDREPAGTGAAEALLINPLRISLVKGELSQLDYRPVKGDGTNADRVCVVFGVDPGGERIAAVDSFGLVIAGGDTGHAVVRATVPGTRFVKQISVEVRGDSVRFETREVSMAPGTMDTVAMVVPAQNNRRINPIGIFQFQSSDESKARVSPVAPVVTAVAPGTARIVAQNSAYPGDIPLVVHVHRPVARLMVAPADTVITLAMQGTHQLRVEARAADTSAIPEVPLRWAMPDSTVVRFDTATKTLRGLKIGETRVQVSVPVGRDSLLKWQWRVRVVAGGLAISRSKVALGVGERAPISVQLLDDRRQPIGPATDLTWTSDSAARVDSGRIIGLAMGRARLVARARWDSTTSTEVYTVGDLLVSAVRGGRRDLFMVQRAEPPLIRAVTQDSALEEQPAWAPSLMQIAFVARPNSKASTSDLYVANADGSDARRLTNDTAAVRSPAFVGPSGEQIVFESNKGGRQQLYVINRDGTGRRALTSGDSPNLQPDVSPDGKKVLFASFREKNYDIYEMNLDGTGEPRRLTTNPAKEDSPIYAADGRSFYYLREESGTPPTKRVYVQDLATEAAQPVTPVGMYVSSFSVSADGHTLALTVLEQKPDGSSESQVQMFDRATGGKRPLVLPGAELPGWPSFRPATPH